MKQKCVAVTVTLAASYQVHFNVIRELGGFPVVQTPNVKRGLLYLGGENQRGSRRVTKSTQTLYRPRTSRRN